MFHETCQLVLAVLIGSALVGSEIPDAVGKYQCPTNMVLAVIDVADNAIYMQCLYTNVCDQPVTCSYAPSSCQAPNPQSLSFMAGFEEYDKQEEYATKSCCTWLPQPDEHQETMCYNLKIRDVTPWVEGWTPPKDVTSDPINIASRRRVKRGGKFVEPMNMGHAMTFLHNRPHHNKYLLVNDITRTPEDDGYIIVACKFNCRSTTTTTTTTTTSTETPRTQTPPDNTVTQNIPRPENPGPNVIIPPGQDSNSPIDLGHIGKWGTGVGVCFSGEMEVITERGAVAMKHLNDNDKVLTDNNKFENIELWYHRMGEDTTQYVQLRVRGLNDHVERSLQISHHHLLPVMNCNKMAGLESPIDYSKYANRAQVGDCVQVWNNDDQVFEMAEVMQVEEVQAEGIFSPVTESGSLIVNGIQVSCFSTMENHPVQKALHQRLVLPIARAVHYVSDMLFDSTKPSDGDVPMHLTYLSYLSNLVVGNKMV